MSYPTAPNDDLVSVELAYTEHTASGDVDYLLLVFDSFQFALSEKQLRRVALAIEDYLYENDNTLD